jgi:hypothetical protein
VFPKYKAVYYSIKDLVSIITENYALALFENKNALNYDEIYVNAFHRRCSAHSALNLLDLALKDFKTVFKMQPNNKDSIEKYDEVMKEIKLR